MGKAEDYIEEALAAYELGAPVVGSVRFGEGHINDTFCVHTQPPDGACRRFILQRISAAAFGNPEQLMRNVVGVTDYLKKVIAREGGNPDRETLTILRTRTGTCYFTDRAGGAWRCTPFIEHTVCLQAAETPELFYASAKAFGRFQRPAAFSATFTHSWRRRWICPWRSPLWCRCPGFSPRSSARRR